jgi:nicotinamidase-related amidase
MGWGSRPALLIIDVCTAYWTPSSPLSLLGNPAAEAAPDSMRQLVAAAREGKGVPVIWSQVEYTSPDMADAGLFWRKAKVLDVWLRGDERGLAKCLDGLEPQDKDRVVVKKYASAFFGTTLATELQVS